MVVLEGIKDERNTGGLVECEGENFMQLFSTVMEGMEAVLSKGYRISQATHCRRGCGARDHSSLLQGRK